MPIVIPDDLPYSPPGIECLRFGARRGGTGIGCCAVDIFQGFSRDPSDTRPDIILRQGDTWNYLNNYGEDGVKAVSGTNEEVFLSYLYHGTMDYSKASDHAFLAILTDEQINSSTGRRWLEILKREGFVWVGATSNSVYCEYHPNHIFMMIRSTREYMDDGEIMALKEPPEYWKGLAEPEETPEERLNSGKVRPSIITVPRPETREITVNVESA